MEKSMKAGRRVPGGRRAFVTVYMAFAMLTLLPMVGLAIDFSVLYNVKARLQQACDAAAIGAGTEVQRSTNVNDPTQNANLRNAVLRFFNANFSPAPWSATQASYSSSITQDAVTKIRTINVTASYYVPMLFMRVLGIKGSTVAGQAIADLRFVNLMIVVDRSGSVDRTGSGSQTNPQIIEGDLNQFVGNSATSIFVNGRDVVGLVSFGGNYYVDFQPTTNFQTASPNIGTKINNIFFDNNSTNTGEGLYQAWYQLTQLNQTGALNVILLITDGRPSAFTGSFPVAAGSSCTNKTNKTGVIDGNVSSGGAYTGFPENPPLPVNGVIVVSPPCNMSAPFIASCESNTAYSLAPNSSGCAYASNFASVATDIPTIPALIGPIDHITGANVPYQTTFTSTSGYYSGGGTNVSSYTAVRYAAFNYAANVAAAIRTDTTYSPVIYSVGLNFNAASFPNEEPLDADFLAVLANDPSYTSAGKPNGVYQSGQTPGRYYDVTYSGLAAALSDITSQILRLAAH